MVVPVSTSGRTWPLSWLVESAGYQSAVKPLLIQAYLCGLELVEDYQAVIDSAAECFGTPERLPDDFGGGSGMVRTSDYLGML